VATAGSPDRDYSLSIHYRAANSDQEEVIEAAFMWYVRLANFGKEPIRREDLAPANPLRVEVEGMRTLDIGFATAGRDVTQVRLTEPEILEDRAVARIEFDFLDYHDGAVVRVLGTGPRAELRVVGDIIGMPSGIVCLDETPTKTWWAKVGFGLWILAEVLAFAAGAAVIHKVTGSWSDVWLLAVPVAAFFLPVFLALALGDWWPPRAPRRKFPDRLALPRWLGPFRHVAFMQDGDMMHFMPRVDPVADEATEANRTE
jgi:hypothetical protein